MLGAAPGWPVAQRMCADGRFAGRIIVLGAYAMGGAKGTCLR